MNDFTKEELESIRDNLVVPECFNQKSILYNAYRKLLGIIDNYCEHKEQEIDADGGISLVCKSCGKTTMDI